MNNQKKINLPGKNQKTEKINEKSDRELLEEMGLKPDEIIKEYGKVFDEITTEYKRISRIIDKRTDGNGLVTERYMQTENRAVRGASFRKLRKITEKDASRMLKDDEKLKALQKIVDNNKMKERKR